MRVTSAQHDHLGSATQAISDTAGTATTQRYYPYGAQRGGGEVDTPYQYTGQKWEENDALEVYYYKARWYDPALRRFLQPDTIVPNASDPQSLNRYSYAANSPIGNSDPTGHAVFSDVGAHLLYNPVNNNVMVRDISGSGLYQVIAQVSIGRASAEWRLREILYDTAGLGMFAGFDPLDDKRGGFLVRTQFQGVGSVRGDIGFAPEFRDNYLYAKPGRKQTPVSRQTGHFLTAVSMGTRGAWVRSIVGHEQSSDSFLWTGGPFRQIAMPSADDQGLFLNAVILDATGDSSARDVALYQILSPEKYGPLTGRRGNSMEDLRLSVRGWRLGVMVSSGQLRTNKELANWIALNVAGD